jgi:prolyl-tRNA synthetase
MGTSHLLGQNFARVFETQFLTEAGTQEYVWQTSWGVSTRLIGALIMGHGDDGGLRVPPALAPVQAVVLVVRDDEGAGERAAALVRELRDHGVRAELDARLDTSFGRRAVEWELKGVPVRLEVGPRDLAAGNATLVRRDAPDKSALALDGIGAHVAGLLDDVQRGLFEQARIRRDARVVDVAGPDDAIAAAQDGFARVPWGAIGEADGERQLATKSVSVRCLQRADGSVPLGHDEPELVAIVGRAY